MENILLAYINERMERLKISRNEARAERNENLDRYCKGKLEELRRLKDYILNQAKVPKITYNHKVEHDLDMDKIKRELEKQPLFVEPDMEMVVKEEDDEES